MAIAALVGMDQQRVVGWMTADTERGVEDITVAGGRVVDIAGMTGGGFLVFMTVQAIHFRANRPLVGVGNDVIDMGTGEG